MPFFKIKTGDCDQHRVEAKNERGAITKWLNDMGYEGIYDAAEQHLCEPHEIIAVKLVYLG
jgi:hypothetical protein